MKEKFVCSICGKTYSNLDEYLNCVSKCGEKLKKETDEKKEKEYRAALDRVNAAKKYYEDQLKDFNNKYPDKAIKKATFNKPKHESKHKSHSLEFNYSDDGKNKPKMSAKVDGKKLEDDFLNKLFDDSEITYLGKLLGIM